MKALNLRLPDNLHSALTTLAQEDRRSLNSEIVTLLEQAVRDREKHR